MMTKEDPEDEMEADTDDPIEEVTDALDALRGKVDQLCKQMGPNRRDLEDAIDDLTEVLKKRESGEKEIVIPAPVVNVSAPSATAPIVIPAPIVNMPEMSHPQAKGAIHQITGHDSVTGRISRIETTFIY